MGYGRSRLKKMFVAISRIFFLPSASKYSKKKVNNKPSFYKRDLIQIVCLFQPKKIDTLYVIHTYYSAIFFPPLFVSILQKKNNSKKHFLFVCQIQICVNKNQRPFQTE